MAIAHVLESTLFSKNQRGAQSAHRCVPCLYSPLNRRACRPSVLLACAQGQSGGDRIRTDDPLVANQVLYQLSYAPMELCLLHAASPSQLADHSDATTRLVGLTGFEPVTSRLSGERSNQLSYRPG